MFFLVDVRFNRGDHAEDPWISPIDHFDAIGTGPGTGKILYGENGVPGPHSENILPAHNGANVYVRLSTGMKKQFL